MVGLSNADPGQIRAAHEVLGDALVSVQNQFSPAFRSSRPEIEVCAELGLAFLPWSPLGGLSRRQGAGREAPGVPGGRRGPRRQRPAGRPGLGAGPVRVRHPDPGRQTARSRSPTPRRRPTSTSPPRSWLASTRTDRGGDRGADAAAECCWAGTPVRGTISQVSSDTAATQRLRDLALLRPVRDRIDREYAQPLDVEALARGVHMSAGHLSRAVQAGVRRVAVRLPDDAAHRAGDGAAAPRRPERHRGLLRGRLLVARHLQHPVHRAGRHAAERLPARGAQATRPGCRRAWPSRSPDRSGIEKHRRRAPHLA